MIYETILVIGKLSLGVLKLWEKVNKQRLRKITIAFDNQFAFMFVGSMMEAIFILRQLIEKCSEREKSIYGLH